MREEDLQKLNELVASDGLLEVETNITNIMAGKEADDTTVEPLVLNESDGSVSILEDYEKELFNDLITLAEIQSRIDEKKTYIKSFVEANKTGSFKTKLLKVSYTSATTSTSIDTKLLKAELPDVAAKYSKTSARSSSIKVEPIAQKTV